MDANYVFRGRERKMSKRMNPMMTQARRRYSLTGSLAVISLLLLIAPMLAGCAEPVAIAAVAPTPTAYPPPTDIPPPLSGPTPAALDFPLPAPTHVELGQTDGRHCVDCHTDEETLKAVAENAEENQESLSEGEG
jgi:hypothetical protein